jgi:hypothetical protein
MTAPPTPDRDEFEAEKAEAIVAGGGLNRGSQTAQSPLIGMSGLIGF